MVNLFQRLPAEPGSLTVALLALLEHSDPEFLNAFLRRGGITAQIEAGAEVQVQFPAPDGPPAAGLIAAPHQKVTVLTQAPGERWDPSALTGLSGSAVAVTLAGKGDHTLSWEQVDRWLAVATEQYDPNTRTGFLIRQFRGLLAELGIEYFAGFATEQVERAPGALTVIGEFYKTTDSFFERFGPTLASAREGVAQVRQSQPQDLLAGYCYRDYAGTAFGPTAFLRVAFHLPQKELQVSFWLVPSAAGPGADGHARLGEALTEDAEFLALLRQLEHDPLLWLWSPAGEKKLALDDLQPAALTDLTWPQYQAGIQCHLSFDALPGEGLVERVTDLAEELLHALSPVLTSPLH